LMVLQALNNLVPAALVASVDSCKPQSPSIVDLIVNK